MLSHFTLLSLSLSHSPFLDTEDEIHSEDYSAKKNLCEIKFIGVYPSMKIVDIQGEGVASQISKASLWKMLSISK